MISILEKITEISLVLFDDYKQKQMISDCSNQITASA